MEKLKIAIVGVGGISNSHIAAYRANPNAEVYAFCDINAERQEAVGVIVRHVVEMFDPDLKLTLTTDPETAMTDAETPDRAANE